MSNIKNKLRISSVEKGTEVNSAATDSGRIHPFPTFSIFHSPFSIFILLILISCTPNRFINFRPINDLTMIDSLSVSHAISKIDYLPIDNTYYILDEARNSLSIYKNGVFFNQILITGLSRDIMRTISDFCVWQDGSIFIIDSFERTIVRFDKDGRYINHVRINSITAPEKIAISSFGSFYIYDSHSKEIYVLNAFDFSVQFSFGKFQIDRADDFFIIGDFLNIYDKMNNETTIFLINGLLENTFSGFTFYDTYRNLITINETTIYEYRTGNELFKNYPNIHSFYISGEFINLVILTNSSISSIFSYNIKTFRGVYETR